MDTPDNVITSEEINLYIQNIPSAPTVVRQALQYARAGDLIKAAKSAEEDPALRHYLKILVNRPLYGFKNEVSDVSQIFGILGVSATQQCLYNYLLSILTPKKWVLFSLTNHQFYDLQAALSQRWEKILTHLKIDNKEIRSAITLIPATIIVCEALFSAHKNEVNQLRSVKALDYNTILHRLSTYDLFSLAGTIGKLWEMDELSILLIESSSGLKEEIPSKIKTLAQWIHLLLFYELSQSIYVMAGLNEFIDFQIDFVEDIYEEFTEVMGYSCEQ
ncbi:MAG: histidine kinase [Sulfuricurvum sp.]|uniref:HDOD domain-containing protein n=1 Tax=Sulfuricurvum sp. TaxID=2025608 RepID=UPI002606F2C5|nr:histidine kinase [Sulfuricurvum sp.]MDD2829716.1 histidine kinase [Sulfuricurvum sp.]MDD4949186.1 histidine kinase [Sulfuricurvum sp.]